jgi:hypothetical protein
MKNKFEAIINKKCRPTHMSPFPDLDSYNGNFVIETCHKWVHGNVHKWKKANQSIFEILRP